MNKIITIYESWFADVTAMISDISTKRKDCAFLVSIDANAEFGRNEIDELIDDNVSRRVCVTRRNKITQNLNNEKKNNKQICMNNKHNKNLKSQIENFNM